MLLGKFGELGDHLRKHCCGCCALVISLCLQQFVRLVYLVRIASSWLPYLRGPSFSVFGRGWDLTPTMTELSSDKATDDVLQKIATCFESVGG